MESMCQMPAKGPDLGSMRESEDIDGEGETLVGWCEDTVCLKQLSYEQLRRSWCLIKINFNGGADRRSPESGAERSKFAPFLGHLQFSRMEMGVELPNTRVLWGGSDKASQVSDML